MAVLTLSLALLSLFAGILRMSAAGSTGALRNPAFTVRCSARVLLVFTKNPYPKNRQRQIASSILSAPHPKAADAP